MKRRVAWFLPNVARTCKARKLAFNGGDKMSDFVSYALLAAIFVITGLRMFVEKPKKLTETEALHGRSSGND
jgi:hypothetical protein